MYTFYKILRREKRRTDSRDAFVKSDVAREYKITIIILFTKMQGTGGNCSTITTYLTVTVVYIGCIIDVFAALLSYFLC